jgi:DNA repair photolyase
MESRTKSSNISSLLKLHSIPVNSEIAFSLNPQSVISLHERLSSSLDDRIDSINMLLDK